VDIMLSISRRSVLNAIVITILLATLPGAIRKLIQTGDPYLFSRRFFEDMVTRLSGPGRLRFIMQPVVAILLGTRDGVKDARAGMAPFLWGLAFHEEHRGELLRSWFRSVESLVAIAILMDIISQYLIFRNVHPGAAVILGPVLISLPYVLARAFANRISRRMGPGPAAHVG
jgi:hypothetical protein